MQVFKVIKYDGPNNVFVWKFPGEDFNTLSQLIVHESQEAIFFKDGRALDGFGAGRYTLHSQNIPLVRRLVNLPFNGESPFHCEVFFINKVVSMDMRWGTNGPIPVQDAVYKVILPVWATGQFAVRIVDSRKFLTKLVGTVAQFDQVTLIRYFQGILMTNIKDYIATQFTRNRITFLEIQSRLKDISRGIKVSLEREFIPYGLELVNFNVDDLRPPEDDPSYMQIKKALAKKAEMTIMGYDYQQERTYNILDRAASNEGGSAGIMNASMGLGMGIPLGSMVGNAMGNVMASPQPTAAQTPSVQASDTVRCPKCGSSLQEGAKFCLECGSKIEPEVTKLYTTCLQCGERVPRGKFCLACGCKLQPSCPNCGAQLVQGAKFCLECGTKLAEEV